MLRVYIDNPAGLGVTVVLRTASIHEAYSKAREVNGAVMGDSGNTLVDYRK